MPNDVFAGRHRSDDETLQQYDLACRRDGFSVLHNRIIWMDDLDVLVDEDNRRHNCSCLSILVRILSLRV